MRQRHPASGGGDGSKESEAAPGAAGDAAAHGAMPPRPTLSRSLTRPGYIPVGPLPAAPMKAGRAKRRRQKRRGAAAAAGGAGAPPLPEALRQQGEGITDLARLMHRDYLCTHVQPQQTQRLQHARASLLVLGGMSAVLLLLGAHVAVWNMAYGPFPLSPSDLAHYQFSTTGLMPGSEWRRWLQVRGLGAMQKPARPVRAGEELTWYGQPHKAHASYRLLHVARRHDRKGHKQHVSLAVRLPDPHNAHVDAVLPYNFTAFKPVRLRCLEKAARERVEKRSARERRAAAAEEGGGDGDAGGTDARDVAELAAAVSELSHSEPRAFNGFASRRCGVTVGYVTDIPDNVVLEPEEAFLQFVLDASQPYINWRVVCAVSAALAFFSVKAGAYLVRWAWVLAMSRRQLFLSPTVRRELRLFKMMRLSAEGPGGDDGAATAAPGGIDYIAELRRLQALVDDPAALTSRFAPGVVITPRWVIVVSPATTGRAAQVRVLDTSAIVAVDTSAFYTRVTSTVSARSDDEDGEPTETTRRVPLVAAPWPRSTATDAADWATAALRHVSAAFRASENFERQAAEAAAELEESYREAALRAREGLAPPASAAMGEDTQGLVLLNLILMASRASQDIGHPASPAAVAAIRATARPARVAAAEAAADHGMCVICCGEFGEAESDDEEDGRGAGAGAMASTTDGGADGDQAGEHDSEDTVVTWPCPGKHRYHWECIHHWLRRGNTCPTCRHKVAAAPQDALWRTMLRQVLT